MLGGVRCRFADGRNGVENLAMEVTELNLIAIDESELPNACAGQVQCHWTAQSTSADDCNPSLQDEFLAITTDLWEDHLPPWSPVSLLVAINTPTNVPYRQFSSKDNHAMKIINHRIRRNDQL